MNQDGLTAEERTAVRVRRILHGEGIPPFARHAQELLGRTLDPDGGSSSLANVILKDMGLTSQILRVANSPFYNHSGRAMTAVAHAISMLGWDTVRNMVSAMRFVEHYANQSPGLRQLMMFSLLTATHGRQVAAAVGYPRPEEAYLCGMLRNLGEVVMARYYGGEYADMLLIVEQERIPMKTAAFRVFELDLDDVARRLATAWNMPGCVRLCLQDGRTAVTSEQRSLASVIQYGHELTKSLYREATGLESVHLRPVLDPLGKSILIVQRDLRRIVDCAVEDTRQTFQALRIPMASLRLDEQVEQAREVLAGGHPDPEPEEDSALEAVLADLEDKIDSDDFEIGGTIQELLDALTAHAGFDCALFALMSEDRASIRGRLASGADPETALRTFSFVLSGGDPALAAAIYRKQDLWINRNTDTRYERSAVVSAFEPVEFALFPVVVDGIVAGLLYAGRKCAGGDGLRAVVDRVRVMLAESIAKKRLA